MEGPILVCVVLAGRAHAFSTSAHWCEAANAGSLVLSRRVGLHFSLILTLSKERVTNALNISAVLVYIHDQGLDLSRLRLLVHVLDQVTLALDSPVGDLADLLRVESFPSLVIQVLVEGHDVNGIDEVDEGISNVAAIVQIEGQVEEVIAPLVLAVDALEEHLLSVLVRDVADHDRRARVLPTQNAV